jgi:hypothetical protein
MLLTTCLCIKQALYPRDADSSMQKYAHSQIDANTKTAHFHDEFKVQLPPSLSPEHHLLFTFFHVDLQMKLEAPKPVRFYFAPLCLSLTNYSVYFFPIKVSFVVSLLIGTFNHSRILAGNVGQHE